jgi:hypothetical protein
MEARMADNPNSPKADIPNTVKDDISESSKNDTSEMMARVKENVDQDKLKGTLERYRNLINDTYHDVNARLIEGEKIYVIKVVNQTQGEKNNELQLAKMFAAASIEIVANFSERVLMIYPDKPNPGGS